MVSVYIAQPRCSQEALVLPQSEVLNIVDSSLGGITTFDQTKWKSNTKSLRVLEFVCSNLFSIVKSYGF